MVRTAIGHRLTAIGKLDESRELKAESRGAIHVNSRELREFNPNATSVADGV
jgi:hypothetical protein